MQSCIRLQNFLHFSHVTRSHFSFRYTNFTSLTFPQRPRQQGSGILILQAYSKRGKETGRSRNVHPLVPEGSTKTYGILTSHVAWRQPQQTREDGGSQDDHRMKPKLHSRAARAMVDACWSRRHTSTGSHSPSALAGRGSQRPAPPHAYAHGSRSALPYQTRPTATDPRLRWLWLFQTPFWPFRSSGRYRRRRPELGVLHLGHAVQHPQGRHVADHRHLLRREVDVERCHT